MPRYRFVVPVLLSLGAAAGPSAALGQVSIGLSITIAPPVLPVYVQPPIPAPGYIWTPGYWAYGPDGYYWVPGTWVQPPSVGLLWTPGWWGWNNGVYVFNAGYWGPTVGFYGGVNYGYGYGGVGYQGGYWNHGSFFYNRNVNNISNVRITNVYNRTVINNTTTNVSYNGGQGGITARPTPQQEAYARQAHTPPTALQTQQERTASTNRALLASVNNGRPPIAATSRPGEFTGRSVVPATNAAVRQVPGPTTAGQRPATPERPGAAPALRPPAEAGRPLAPHPGPAAPGATPPLRPPAETARPVAVPHPAPAAPETRAPATEVHAAPPRPAPVRPEAAPQVRAAPPPRPAPHPAPQREEEKKPPPG
jgi:hypothetical protein